MSGCRTTEVVNLRDVPDAADVLDARGLTCGELEPLMAKRLRALAPGEVLEILSDQAAAEDGIAAWSWLSGNVLTMVLRETAPNTRYYVCRKQPQP